MQYYKLTVKPENLLSDLSNDVAVSIKLCIIIIRVNYLQATFKRGHKHCARNVTGHYLAIYTPQWGAWLA